MLPITRAEGTSHAARVSGNTAATWLPVNGIAPRLLARLAMWRVKR
jgi:hypothetical protein